jgi:hypothetical protein
MKQFKNFMSLFYALIAIITVVLCGKASDLIAMSLANMGTEFPIRDLINLGLILVIINLGFAKKKPIITISEINTDAIFSGVSVGFLLVGIAWIIAILKNGVLIGYAPQDGNLLPIFGGFFILLLHGFAEQFIIQKFVRQYLIKDFGIIGGTLITALCFPIIQALQGYYQPIYLINGIVIGLLFTLLANLYGAVAPSVAHSIWSWLELITIPQIYFFFVRPNNPFFSGNDTYGSYSIMISGGCLLFALLLLQIFSYKGEKKANYDKK